VGCREEGGKGRKRRESDRLKIVDQFLTKKTSTHRKNNNKNDNNDIKIENKIENKVDEYKKILPEI
jgi:hypothetical protein